MNIRALFPRDMEEVRKIHEKFYDKEFSFDDLRSKFISSFIIHEDDRVICAGGVRSIAEVVLVTDKDISTRQRVNALVMAHDASKYIAAHSGHEYLHAFVQDEGWLKQLLKYGFNPTKGDAVITSVK